MKLQRPDPGIDAAKSGLHGKAGIFFSAGLLEKGEPRFDLQDLDPYLLFDSRESMIGTLENPTLDLNPAAPSTLDVITATRGEGLQLDGVNDYVDLNQSLVPASGNFEISIQYTHTEQSATNRYLLSQGNSVSTFFGISINNDQVLAYTQGTNPGSFATTSISRGATYNFKITRVGDVFTLFINGSSAGTQTQTGLSVSTNTNTFIGQSTWASDRFVKGVVSNVSKDGVTYYQGNGNTAADWIDLVGSNDATLNGSPSVFAPATFTDANGNIASAPANTVRVDYTQGAELTPTKFQNIGYTDFSQGWTLQAGITLNSNTTETVSPEGQNNAAKVVSTDNTKGFFFGGLNLSVAAIRTIYLKGASGGETITLKDPSGYGTPIVHTLTTDWVRYEMATTNDGNSYQGLFIDDISVGTIYVYGPQLEEGTTASDFVANTTGSPKFIASATFGPRVPMILVEPSATNLLTATQEASSWSSTNVSVTSNTTTAPDGSQTGDTVTRTAGGADVRQTKAVTSGTSYTMSIFAKAETDNQIQLDFSNSSMGADNVEFNTRTGQKVSGSNNYTITELANGWRRYSFTSNCISSGNTGVIIRIENDEPVELWGFQFEEGSVATSYIPHISGATSTRVADDLVISGSDFSDFYNQSEGTFYVESVPNENTFGSFLFDLSFGNASTERLAIYNSGSNQKIFLKSSGTTYSDKIIGNRPAGGVLSRVAISCKTNNIQASIDGGNMTPDTGATMSTTINKMTIGNRYENPNYLNGRIRRLIFWPYHSESL